MEISGNQRIFDHSFLPRGKIKRIDSEEGRIYETPEGNRYPSVTTVLKHSPVFWENHQSLQKWRERVGEDEADKIMRRAANQGTEVHGIIERYMKNSPRYKKDAMPLYLEAFFKIKPYLDKNIGIVFGVEYPVYSDKLKTAGTVDLIASWNGTRSIVDFKRTRTIKDPEWIKAYFVQATCYGLMLNEQMDKLEQNFVQQIVIVVIPDDGDPQILCHGLGDYLPLTLKIFPPR